MTIHDLAKQLSDMYFNSNEGEAVAMIHLFGIKYATEIKECGASSSELVRLAKLNKSYSAELSKGIKLAKFVVAKD